MLMGFSLLNIDLRGKIGTIAESVDGAMRSFIQICSIGDLWFEIVTLLVLQTQSAAVFPPGDGLAGQGAWEA